jgi:hypothetical protein
MSKAAHIEDNEIRLNITKQIKRQVIIEQK